jgi:hypothetical protein
LEQFLVKTHFGSSFRWRIFDFQTIFWRFQTKFSRFHEVNSFSTKAVFSKHHFWFFIYKERCPTKPHQQRSFMHQH